MTTISVTLEDNSMVASLRSILMQLKGVKDVTVFDTGLPNKKTIAAMNELEQGGGKGFATVDALFADLEIG